MIPRQKPKEKANWEAPSKLHCARGVMDSIADRFAIYKVKTIGDGQELPDTERASLHEFGAETGILNASFCSCQWIFDLSGYSIRR